MDLLLRREILDGNRTIGRLFIDGDMECYTLEDAVRPSGEKIPGKTAIPAGKYAVVMTLSQRFQRVLPLLLDVPNFTGIRIHSGNTEADTEGCILVGQFRTPTAISQSRIALEKLLPRIQAAIDSGDRVSIEICNG